MHIQHHTFLATAGVVFLFAGLLHLIRAVMGWSLVIADFSLPLWVSWLVAIFILYLAYTSFRLKAAK